MTEQDAIDIISTYGTNRKKWPASSAADVESLVQSSTEVSKHLKRAKQIDDLLKGWNEDEESDTSIDDDDGAEGSGDQDEIELDEEFAQDFESMMEKVIEGYMASFSDGEFEEFRVFTRDYDDLVDIEVEGTVDMAPINTSVAKSAGVLQKELRRLMAAKYQSRRRPGMKSGRINAPSLHRLMSGDDRVFFKREEQPDVNTAVSLVIDCSGSMSGGRIKLATEAAFALGSTLNKLGIAFEIIGFTTAHNHPIKKDKNFQDELKRAASIVRIARSEPIEIPKFKTFDESWSLPIQSRFGCVFNTALSNNNPISMGGTPEGCGVDFAARRLARRPEQRKIMMVMTDGEPAGTINQVGIPATSHREYYWQSVNVVKKVAASGIDILGIGIAHNGPTGYYPNSIVINNVNEMPAKLMSELKKFLI